MSVDAEAMLARFLREQPDVASLVDDRVYTDLPHKRTYPMVVLQRTGGGPLFNKPPNWLVENEMTFDFYGGTHKMAQTVMSTCLAAMADRLPGTQPEGVVTAVRGQVVTYQPEEEATDESGHARPRFQVRVNVLTHP